MTDTPKTVELLPADPNYVIALALFHAERGDPTLLVKIRGEMQDMRAERRAKENRWLDQHRAGICRQLAAITDPALARRVAGLIGYAAEN